MQPSNKIMMTLLTKIFKFECTACDRYWDFNNYQNHKKNGNCKKDPNAVNTIGSLKAS